jgi:hypothetical protein
MTVYFSILVYVLQFNTQVPLCSVPLQGLALLGRRELDLCFRKPSGFSFLDTERQCAGLNITRSLNDKFMFMPLHGSLASVVDPYEKRIISSLDPLQQLFYACDNNLWWMVPF